MDIFTKQQIAATPMWRDRFARPQVTSFLVAPVGIDVQGTTLSAAGCPTLAGAIAPATGGLRPVAMSAVVSTGIKPVNAGSHHTSIDEYSFRRGRPPV